VPASPVIVWFRQDLRLHDNAALSRALETGGPVIPLYIFDEAPAGAFAMGGAARWWLHHSLAALSDALSEFGARLVIRRGDASEILNEVVEQTGARSVYWNRRYEPFFIDQDKAAKARLAERGVGVETFNAKLLFEPWQIENKQGDPYKVFTPFWKRCLEDTEPEQPLAVPKRMTVPERHPESLHLDDLALLPRNPDWAGGLRATWRPGEHNALKALDDFLETAVMDYKSQRDRPDRDATSRLSPCLRFGEISPRLIWHRVRNHERGANADKFLSELGWREFSYHLLYHFPGLIDRPLRPEFARFPWRDNQAHLSAWRSGRTGYPIVDAGMRQLWQTGWLHNRVRMVVASFLVKDLLIPWQTGARWFWATLVDADLASNSASWQWVAGCGADAAPYFRIFNPVLQGKKFDPDGKYIRTWIPELRDFPDDCIHEPWKARGTDLLSRDKNALSDYPGPIVNHSQARNAALEAYEQITK